MVSEVQEIIQKLKDLQLQQAELVVHLEKARDKESSPGVNERTAVDQREQEVHRPRVNETREIAIRDRVKIRNPNPFQPDNGIVITKVGKSRITVQTKAGGKILGAVKNLVKLYE